MRGKPTRICHSGISVSGILVSLELISEIQGEKSDGSRRRAVSTERLLFPLNWSIYTQMAAEKYPVAGNEASMLEKNIYYLVEEYMGNWDNCLWFEFWVSLRCSPKLNGSAPLWMQTETFQWPGGSRMSFLLKLDEKEKQSS